MLTLAMVLTAEAVNTAVEQAVELSSPKVNPTARIARTAAAAVLISSVSAVVVGALLFYQPENLFCFYGIANTRAGSSCNIVAGDFLPCL